MEDWRQAYFDQALTDYDLLKKLMRENASRCPQLHYLQMATEKLAKGFLTRPGGGRYPKVHDAFVRFIRVVPTMDHIRGTSRFANVAQYRQYISSLRPIAQGIEDLSPEGSDHPNPEYPWESDGSIYTPVAYSFSDLDPASPKMLRLLGFLDDCFASIR